MNEKDILINEIENLKGGYWYNEKILDLCIKSIKSYDYWDEDLQIALECEIGVDIVKLFCDIYTYEEFCVWLCEHDFEIFNQLNLANIVYRKDYESEEDFIENSGAFYNGEADCLIYNEEKGVAVKSW